MATPPTPSNRVKRSYFFDSQPNTTGDRFRTKNIPSEGTYKMLVNSVAFIMEPGDAATPYSRGLVKASTDIMAMTNRYDSNYQRGEEKFVYSHQLPGAMIWDGFSWKEPKYDISTGTEEELTGSGIIIKAVHHIDSGIEKISYGIRLDRSYIKLSDEFSGTNDGDVLQWRQSSSAWSVGALSIGHLFDVDLTTPPANGQVLIYDAASLSWKPGSITSGTSTFKALTDTPADFNMSDGMFLKVDEAGNRIVFEAIVLNTLKDTDVSVVNDNYALVWDNTLGKWTGKDMAIHNLSDIDYSTPPSNGDILVYNGLRWKPAANTSSDKKVAVDMGYTASYLIDAIDAGSGISLSPAPPPTGKIVITNSKLNLKDLDDTPTGYGSSGQALVSSGSDFILRDWVTHPGWYNPPFAPYTAVGDEGTVFLDASTSNKGLTLPNVNAINELGRELFVVVEFGGSNHSIVVTDGQGNVSTASGSEPLPGHSGTDVIDKALFHCKVIQTSATEARWMVVGQSYLA